MSYFCEILLFFNQKNVKEEEREEGGRGGGGKGERGKGGRGKGDDGRAVPSMPESLGSFPA